MIISPKEPAYGIMLASRHKHHTEKAMKFVLAHEGDGAVITISGVMKKEHAKQIAETIAEVSRLKPKKLALDCSEL